MAVEAMLLENGADFGIEKGEGRGQDGGTEAIHEKKSERQSKNGGPEPGLFLGRHERAWGTQALEKTRKPWIAYNLKNTIWDVAGSQAGLNKSLS
jgi:hypothetical protein